jgi:hypothetical protein
MHVVYAKFTSWVTPSVQIVEGEAWRADDPIVRLHPDWFSDLPKIVRTTLPRHLQVDPPVEQATAAPGELRVVRPRADQAAAEVEALRAQLLGLGVKADGRWSLVRLREELVKAQGAA